MLLSLDYCNSIVYGCPSYEIEKLQSVQIAAARHIKKYDHITPILKELHWVPVEDFFLKSTFSQENVI